MAVNVAQRNFFESRTRMAVTVGGVAFAMILVLVLDGVFAGAMAGVTAYIDMTPFDLVVSQQGVRNLHMTSSQFPSADLSRVERVPGVRRVDSILFTSAFLVTGDKRSLAYLIGYEQGRLGAPPAGADVPRNLGHGEIVLDKRIAAENALALGDYLSVLGRRFKVAGFVTGSVSITNSVAYIRRDDFAAATRQRGIASFGLVAVLPGTSPATVEARVRRAVPDLNVLTKSQFADSERRVISDMSTEIIRLMNLVGFLIGLSVVGLTTYTATLAKLREFGVLKALGAPHARLLGIVFQQAVLSIALGLIAAVAITLALAFALTLADTNIRIAVELGSIGRLGVASLIIAVLASAAPMLRVSLIEPADVFRR